MQYFVFACPFATFRPIEDGKLHICLPSLGREFRIGSRVFEALVDDFQNANAERHLSASSRKLLDAGVICRFDEASTDYEFSDWETEGWSPAIEFFLSSRSTNYYDHGQNFEALRRQVFEDYNLAAHCPTFPKPGDDCVQLPASKFIQMEAALLDRSCSERLSNGSVHISSIGSVLQYGHSRSTKNWRPLTDNIDSVFASFGSSIRTLVSVSDCADIDRGTYIYHPDCHLLEPCDLKLHGRDLYDLTYGHDAPLDAAFVVLLTFHEEMAQWRYRHERALLNVFVELGQISQRLLLSAARVGIKTHITPAIDDTGWKEISSDRFGELMYVNSFGGEQLQDR